MPATKPSALDLLILNSAVRFPFSLHSPDEAAFPSALAVIVG